MYEKKGEFSSVVKGLRKEPLVILTKEQAWNKLEEQGAIAKIKTGINIKMVSERPIIFHMDDEHTRKTRCFSCQSTNAISFSAYSFKDMLIAVCPDCRVIKPFGRFYAFKKKAWIEYQQKLKRDEYLASLCPCGCGRPKKKVWAGKKCKQRYATLQSIMSGVGPSLDDLTVQLNFTNRCLDTYRLRQSKLKNVPH